MWMKLVITIVGVSAATCFLCAAFNVWGTSKHATTGSCLSSVWTCLESSSKDSQAVTEISENLGPQWRFLTDSEYDKLAHGISRDGRFDNPEVASDPGSALLDSWGRRILIAGRRGLGSGAEFSVWSKGPDGVFGSDGDISCPSDAAAPEGLTN